MAAAQLENDPATILNNSLNAAAAADAAQLETMKARLDSVQPLPHRAARGAGSDPRHYGARRHKAAHFDGHKEENLLPNSVSDRSWWASRSYS